MKKRIVVLIILIGIFIIFFGVGSKIYTYYNNNGVLVYGKSLSIYEILGNNIEIDEYSELNKYTYKKAKVKSIGNTAHKQITLGNNQITFIGNRDLIKINDNLYLMYKINN